MFCAMCWGDERLARKSKMIRKKEGVKKRMGRSGKRASFPPRAESADVEAHARTFAGDLAEAPICVCKFLHAIPKIKSATCRVCKMKGGEEGEGG